MLTRGGFFSVIMPLDNQSGPLSMFGCDQSTKLCKDIGKELDPGFDPNTQRFGSSLDIGHMLSYPFSSLDFSAGGALSSCSGFWEFAISIQPQCSNG